MSEEWAERLRHTNRLARRLADRLFRRRTINAQHLYGLSKLSWATESYKGDSAAYIRSTKIPALSDLIETDFSKMSIDDVADYIATRFNDHHLKRLVKGHSGFTNFYNSYRKSVFFWIEENLNELLPLYKNAYRVKSENDRLRLVRAISRLPGIPKANHPNARMKPEYFLTPAFFMLDPEIKFPIINGNENVKKLLKILKVSNANLLSKYQALVGLYGTGGIDDAADLDAAGNNLTKIITNKKKLLKNKKPRKGSILSIKDEADVEAIKSAGTLKQKRIHNQLTNKLIDALKDFTLFEGNSETCMYDVLVEGYDGSENDLLIEVKSSAESPHVRMAVGQLYDYWYNLEKNKDLHLAILLPERPEDEIVNFLEWMDIGLLWFEDEQLCTDDDWLENIVV